LAATSGVIVVNDGVPVDLSRVVVPMTFPVLGSVTWRDTFLSCRGTNCDRKHLGQDLIGPRMTPLVAAFDGKVTYLQRGTYPAKTNYVSVRSLDGQWTVNYIHINNDTPGTDDGLGTTRYGFLPGLKIGQYVARGQFLGWMGDSGDAETSVPHLHFELRKGDAWSGTAYNAKPSLDAAIRPASLVRAAVHTPGTLVEVGTGAVYRILADGRKVVVPTAYLPLSGKTRTDAIQITAGELSSYPLAGVEPIPTGLVVRGSSGALFAVVNGRRFPVGAGWLTGVGIKPAAVPTLPDSEVARTALAPNGSPAPGWFREGALIREWFGPTYRISGARLRLATPAYLRASGVPTGQIGTVPRGMLTIRRIIPVGPPLPIPDGNLVRVSVTGTRYVTWGGTSHWAEDRTFLDQYGWSSVRYVSMSATELAQTTPAGTSVYP
jgi:hypothetical protein